MTICNRDWHLNIANCCSFCDRDCRLVAVAAQSSTRSQRRRHRCQSPQSPADLDAFITRVVADQKAIGVTVGVMQDGKVIFNKGYGLANTSTQDAGHDRDAVRGWIGHQAVHLRGRAAAGTGRQAVVRRSRVALSRRLRSRQRDHAARSRQSRLGLSRLLSARLRRSADGEGDRRRDLLKTFTAQAARLRAGLALLVQQHRLPAARQLTALVEPQAVRTIAAGAHLHAARHDAHAVRTDARRAGPRRGLHADSVSVPPKSSIAEGRGWIGAAGGIWSTPEDLMKWDLALMDGKVLNAKSWKTMTTPRELKGGRSSAYGCGQQLRDRGPLLVLHARRRRQRLRRAQRDDSRDPIRGGRDGERRLVRRRARHDPGSRAREDDARRQRAEDRRPAGAGGRRSKCCGRSDPARSIERCSPTNTARS